MTARIAIFLAILALIASCGPVLEEPRLPVAETSGGQQSFDLKPEALTMDVARRLNESPYPRRVQRGGLGQSAGLVSEQSVLKLSPPPSTQPIPYRIGVGDDLQLVIFVTTKGMADDAQGNTLEREARVSADGSLLFIETGRIDVLGKTLAEARDVVGNALIRNGVDPRFQLEVSGFNSQKINLTVVGSGAAGDAGVTLSLESGVKGTGSYPVTERPMTLRELLVSAGLEITRAGVQVVSLDRSGRRYEMPVEHIFDAASPDYYLTGGDTLRVEQFSYAPDRAFILGGGAQPAALPIAPQTRPTLADLLFVEGGPFATKTARSREIYLLRGDNPMAAFHLDAGDPSRIAVAAATELRPNDIVYLSAKPIYELGELLSAVNPLAVFAGGIGG